MPTDTRRLPTSFENLYEVANNGYYTKDRGADHMHHIWKDNEAIDDYNGKKKKPPATGPATRVFGSYFNNETSPERSNCRTNSRFQRKRETQVHTRSLSRCRTKPSLIYSYQPNCFLQFQGNIDLRVDEKPSAPTYIYQKPISTGPFASKRMPTPNCLMSRAKVSPTEHFDNTVGQTLLKKKENERKFERHKKVTDKMKFNTARRASEERRTCRAQQAEIAFAHWLTMKKKREAYLKRRFIIESENSKLNTSKDFESSLFDKGPSAKKQASDQSGNTDVSLQPFDMIVVPSIRERCSGVNEVVEFIPKPSFSNVDEAATPFLLYNKNDMEGFFNRPKITKISSKKQLFGGPLSPAFLSADVSDNKTYQQWAGEKLAKLKQIEQARNEVRLRVGNYLENEMDFENPQTDESHIPRVNPIQRAQRFTPHSGKNSQTSCVVEQPSPTANHSDVAQSVSGRKGDDNDDATSDNLLTVAGKNRTTWSEQPLSDAVIHKPESWIETRIYSPF